MSELLAENWILLAIALWDTLYRTIITGQNPIVSEAVE